MTTTRDFEALLGTCGVAADSLTRVERAELDQRGCVVLAAVVDPVRLAALRADFEAAARPEPTGTRHVPDLVARSASWSDLLSNPRVLAAVLHVIGRPFRLQAASGRDPRPGYGRQGLHTDWPRRAPRDPYHVATALFLLDDYSRENGATRVVPGSHLDPRPLPKPLLVPAARHPREELVRARAGDALVLNGHLLHSGTENGSTGPRRVLQCPFVAADQQPPQEGALPLPATASPLVRWLLAGR